MTVVLSIAAGGAIGALLRYWLSLGAHALLGAGFPYGTLAANGLGSALMGILYVAFAERVELGLELRLGLTVGLLGAFTTFSTFSMETVRLLESGDLLRAAANVLLSVGICLVACWGGAVLARAW